VSWCFWRMCSRHFVLFFQVSPWRGLIPFVGVLSLGKFFFLHLLVEVSTTFSSSFLDPPLYINTMSQVSHGTSLPASEVFKIPDVDLIESLYRHKNIYLSTTRDSGCWENPVNVLPISPMTFPDLIFITEVSNLLISKDWSKGISHVSHGLPDRHGKVFNHLTYTNDISIRGFTQTDTKMQHLNKCNERDIRVHQSSKTGSTSKST